MEFIENLRPMNDDLLPPRGRRERTDFGGFVGQHRVVGALRDVVRHSLEARSPAPHLLLCGPKGYGKTHLGKAIAREYGTNTKHIFVSKKLKRDKLVEHLSDLRHADFLLLDEAHNLSAECEDLLLNAVREFIVRDTQGEKDIEIAKFTVVLCSNRPGQIAKPLRNRMTLEFELDGCFRHLLLVARS